MALLLVHAVDVLGEDRRVTVSVTLCDVNGDALVAEVDGAEVLFSVERRGSELQFDLTPNADIDTPDTFYLVRILDGDTVLWSRVIEKASGTERVLDADSPTPAPTPDAPIALDDLSDVDTTGAVAGNVLGFDGTDWGAVAAGGGGGQVDQVTGVPPVSVDSSDPTAPEVSVDLTGYALQENLENAVGQLQGEILAESVLREAADSTHAADTTAVHGIADTSALVLTNDNRLARTIIAQTVYDPGTTATVSVNSSTLTDLDATNLSVTFNAPSSGSVIVELVARMTTSTGMTAHWGLREASTQVGGLMAMIDNSGNMGSIFQPRTAHIRVTGLTPGNSYTYKWAAKASTGTVSLRAGQSAGNEGAMTMRVFAA